MLTYVFIGRVMPERTYVTISIPPLLGREVIGLGRLDIMISINLAQVSAVIKTTETVVNVPTLRNFVEQIVRTAVDAYGYIEGRGYDIEITSVITPDGGQSVFGVEIDELQKSKSERPVSFEGLWSLLGKCGELRQALADLREAIRSPLSTAFFCFRAVECLRQFFYKVEDGDETGPSWERLRSALRVDRSWILPMETLARAQRHGDFPTMSGSKQVEIMTHAWKVVDRFSEYARGGFAPLPEKGFDVLSGFS